MIVPPIPLATRMPMRRDHEPAPSALALAVGAAAFLSLAAALLYAVANFAAH